MRQQAWLLVFFLLPLGCGSNPACTVTGFVFAAGPATNASTAPDHSLPAPANQEQFQAVAGGETGPNCATPAYLARVPAQWSLSDSKNVSISSASDGTNGLATCLHATGGPVTVTGSLTQNGFTESQTSTIVCR